VPAKAAVAQQQLREMMDTTTFGPGGSVSSKAPQSEELSTIASLYSSSERSNISQGWTETVVWEELRFGQQIKPYRGYAHCVADVRLVSCILQLVNVPDVDSDTVKLLFRALKFLRLCDYSIEDIGSILSHATAYFEDAFALCGSHMDGPEVGHVLVTLMFIAHCYVQDETCPLQVWHQHLFRKYCEVKTLNSAIMRLLEIRKHMLRLEDTDLKRRHELLLGAANKRGRLVSVSPDGPAARSSSNSSTSSSCLPSPKMAASAGSAPRSSERPAAAPLIQLPAAQDVRRQGYAVAAEEPAYLPQAHSLLEAPVPAVAAARPPELLPDSGATASYTSGQSDDEAPVANTSSLLSKVLDHLKGLS